MNPSQMISRWLFLLLVLLLLTACSTGTPTRFTPAPPVDVVVVDTPQPTATEPPPSTPTPTSSPARAILYAPVGANPDLLAELQPALQAQASEKGLQFEVVTSLSSQYLTGDERWVVVLSPVPDLSPLAASAPQVHFIAIGDPDIAVASNLSRIALPPEWLGQQLFLAGYLAAVITPDWRVGAILAGNGPDSPAAQAFRNGLVFYCGLCLPAYPPLAKYPVVASLAPGTGEPERQAVLASLAQGAVKTVYVDPQVGDPVLYQALAEAGMNIIGGAPPAPGSEANWVASIESGEMDAVLELLSQLDALAAGADISPSLEITSVNDMLLSPGRLAFIEDLKNELLAGRVDTGYQP